MKARTSDRASYKDDKRAVPRVWILQGHRAGDNLQLQALAEGLGWPFEFKNLAWQKRLPRWTPFYGRSASLKHLTPEARGAFAPPWPDLVLSIGWRSVPVARWIKQESGARLVHLGRPRAPLSHFDLVLTTPQYRLPNLENVVHLSGPLTTLSPSSLAASAKSWESRLSHLPRPWTAVLVGGDAPTLRFPPSAAAALATECNDHAARNQGSLLVATSPRTSSQVTEALRTSITAPSFFHAWRKDADNPYAAFLALADQFIVTNDSISMTHEAALTGRPVHIFPLTAKDGWQGKALAGLDRKLRRGDTTIAKAYMRLIRDGVIYPPKSPADYFQELFRSGRAITLGEDGAFRQNPPAPPENERAVQAVQALFDTTDVK